MYGLTALYINEGINLLSLGGTPSPPEAPLARASYGFMYSSFDWARNEPRRLMDDQKLVRLVLIMRSMI
jgi:hypothetical protein